MIVAAAVAVQGGVTTPPLMAYDVPGVSAYAVPVIWPPVTVTDPVSLSPTPEPPVFPLNDQNQVSAFADGAASSDAATRIPRDFFDIFSKTFGEE